uniref:RING-type domain-containing protein n=1 Tax=Eutreptiella gymnastica TaxID=73025 RepID=A0A6U8AUM9_9EUGL
MFRHPTVLDCHLKSEVECLATVYTGVRETVMADGVHFAPQSPQDSNVSFHKPPITLPEGDCVSYKASIPPGGADQNIALAQYAPAGPIQPEYRTETPDLIPLAIALSYRAPNSPEGQGFNVHYLYCSLLAAPGNPGSIGAVKVVKQRLQIDGKVFDLQDVYGDAAGGEEDCVICLCDPRNVIVMPCRHLCMCNECAKGLDATPGAKCPICRTPIELMMSAEAAAAK